MYININMCMYLYVYVYIYMYMYMYINDCKHTCTCTCTYPCIGFWVDETVFPYTCTVHVQCICMHKLMYMYK